VPSAAGRPLARPIQPIRGECTTLVRVPTVLPDCFNVLPGFASTYQLLGEPAAAFHASDDLLPDVAAFFEAYFVPKTNFQRDGVILNLSAGLGEAGLDAKNFVGIGCCRFRCPIRV